jgi:DNA (cytosine-5)-methyltransferase 1
MTGGLRELALFAGAGGGILGGKLLGWRTVCAVEIIPYRRSVLLARQRDGILDPFPIWDDVTTFDGNPWRGGVDVVSGGFPCQDISTAGDQAGIRGESSGLWAEYARVVGEVQPRFVLVENSPMLIVRGLDTVLGDLAALGYNAKWGVFSAADVGARHERERMWIVAYPHEMGREVRQQQVSGRPLSRNRLAFVEPGQFAADPGSVRGANGMAAWVDRIAAIGDGQVPAVVRLAWQLLAPRLDTQPGRG